MKIHTLDDKAYELNELPEKINDLNFAILDNSNPKDVDYYYVPLRKFHIPCISIADRR